jgi:hypothetical protein
MAVAPKDSTKEVRFMHESTLESQLQEFEELAARLRRAVSHKVDGWSEYDEGLCYAAAEIDKLLAARKEVKS